MHVLEKLKTMWESERASRGLSLLNYSFVPIQSFHLKRSPKLQIKSGKNITTPYNYFLY